MHFIKPIFNTIILSAFLLAGCGDDEPPQAKEPLIGSWKWLSIERLNCPNAEDEDKINIYDCSSFCYEVEFFGDRTLKATMHEGGETFIGEGTWLRTGDSITFCINDSGNEICTMGTLTLTGNDAFEVLVPKSSDDVCDVIRYYERK